jgi:hypothetical protein
VVLNVELVHGPTPGDSQSQHSPDGAGLDDGAEGHRSPPWGAR